MPNPKPRLKNPEFFFPDDGEYWVEKRKGGSPRPPAIEGGKYYPDGSISVSIRFDAHMPKDELDKAVAMILTWLIYEYRRDRDRPDGARRREEVGKVVEAWNKGTTRKRTRTRSYIAKATGISPHRVQEILHLWREHLKEWDSPDAQKDRQYIEQAIRGGKDYDRRLLDKTQAFIWHHSIFSRVKHP